MKKIGGYEIMMSYWCLIVLIDINRSWSRSRFILEGSEPEPEPEPPKMGRLRNSDLYNMFMFINYLPSSGTVIRSILAS